MIMISPAYPDMLKKADDLEYALNIFLSLCSAGFYRTDECPSL